MIYKNTYSIMEKEIRTPDLIKVYSSNSNQRIRMIIDSFMYNLA